MAIYSPLRSRRLAAQQTEATQRLITFKLGEENFALPLDRVQKVTTLDKLYGDPKGTGLSVTTYQDRELVVIDVGHRIFGKEPQVWLPSQPENIPAVATHPNVHLVRYLLVLQSKAVDPVRLAMSTVAAESQLVGLEIDSAPSIQSMPLSAFQPLLDSYKHIHCVSGMSNVVPVNALLRRRAFRIEGASFVAEKLQSVETTTDINAPGANQASIFLLDATSIVGS